MEARRYLTYRRRAYEILDVALPGDRASGIVHRVLVGLIAISVLLVVLESVPSLEAQYWPVFLAGEIIAAFFFTLEYIARAWASVEHPPLASLPPIKARLAYLVSPGAIIDLLAILPFLLAVILPEELRVLTIIRLARFFKLARYSPGLRSLLDAVLRERRALGACVIIIIGLMLVTASLMHVVEGQAQPDKFGTIPDAMWWSIATLTTVGYGDAVPITPLGKLIAGITAVLGLVMVALPVGIIATSFADMIHKRDFVVTWGMIARVPLFSDLKATDIAEIMTYLRSRAVRGGDVVTRRGDHAACMYFIATGLVEIELPHQRVRLADGQFFGEMAVIRKARRSATVRAIQDTRLLELDADDFHAILDLHPEIARVIKSSADERRAENAAFGFNGDLDQAGLTEQIDSDRD